MRALALDVGNRRIGIALSDPLGLTAQGLPTLNRVSLQADLDAVAALWTQSACSVCVVGLPRLMSGQEGEQAAAARAFGGALQERGILVEYWDERLTSVAATRALVAAGASRKDKQRKGTVDRVAAALILQSWLDARTQ